MTLSSWLGRTYDSTCLQWVAHGRSWVSAQCTECASPTESRQWWYPSQKRSARIPVSQRDPNKHCTLLSEDLEKGELWRETEKAGQCPPRAGTLSTRRSGSKYRENVSWPVEFTMKGFPNSKALSAKTYAASRRAPVICGVSGPGFKYTLPEDSVLRDPQLQLSAVRHLKSLI